MVKAELKPDTGQVILTLVSAIGGGLLALAANMVMVGPQKDQAETAQYVAKQEATDNLITQMREELNRLSERVSAQDREMDSLREDNNRLRSNNIELQLKVVTLEAQITDKDFSFRQVLCEILEAQPGLNWAKMVDYDPDGKPRFIMTCLDGEYRARFQVSTYEYQGFTDYDFWDKETADQFYANDLDVLVNRRPIFTTETWTERNGKRYSGQLTKFYYEYQGVVFIIGHLPRQLVQ